MNHSGWSVCIHAMISCQVQVMYYQTNVRDGYRTMIKPWTSVDYAWDEPTFEPHITCSIPGGTSATYNLNTLGDGDQLVYENFIYITFQSTFDSPSSSSGSSKEPSPASLAAPFAVASSLRRYGAGRPSSLSAVIGYDRNLVLDVIHG